MSSDRVPPGFAPLSSTSPFVTVSGEYYIRPNDGNGATIGTFVRQRHLDQRGHCDRAFVLLFADFALTDTFAGITLNTSAYFLDSARVDEWIAVEVFARGRQGRLIFSEAAVQRENGSWLARVDAVLLSYDERIWSANSSRQPSEI